MAAPIGARSADDEKPKEPDERDSDFSSSDDDDEELDADMAALRRACTATGMDLEDLNPLPESSSVGISPPDFDLDDDDENGMDDFELARSVFQKLSLPSDDFHHQLLSLKPSTIVPPPDSDDEDDYATLRDLQKRFSTTHHTQVAEGSSSNVEKGCVNDESEQVCAPSSKPLGKATSASNLFVKTATNNTSKGFPDDDIITGEDPCDFLSQNDLEVSTINPEEPVGVLAKIGSGFPRSAQLLLDAIKKNRSCKKLIQSKLVVIEARIEENKKLKDNVGILKKFQDSRRKMFGSAFSQKKDPRARLISSPKRGERRVSAIAFGPEDNFDVTICKDILAKSPLGIQRDKWSDEERDNLRKGVKQEFQKALLEKSMSYFSYSEGSSSDIDNVMASIEGHNVTPEHIRAYLPKIDWCKFASIYNKGRTGAECEARWLNCEDPLINSSKWTRKEDKDLLLLVKEKDMNNWIDIAASLGTNRTPFQCLTRFQRSLNAQMIKREWEEKEDAELCAAVKDLGESDWQMVASRLERRTGTQCSNRWRKSLNPARLRVGRWTVDEDRRMKVAVKLFGAKSWNKIAQFVPGRTQVQCRERWTNCLDPSLKRDPWTKDEDMKLMSAVREYNNCWSKIAACIPPRTDNQCRRRWVSLCPDDALKLRAAKKIRKAALISNFVERKLERPDLGPEDFMLLPMICPALEPHSEKQTTKRKRKSQDNPASDIDNEGNTRCSEGLQKRRSGRRIKEIHQVSDSTSGIIDCTEASIGINSGSANDENHTAQHPQSHECIEQGKNDSPSNMYSAQTDRGVVGKLGVHKKGNLFKPRRNERLIRLVDCDEAATATIDTAAIADYSTVGQPISPYTEGGKDDSYCAIDLTPTDTDIMGQPGTQNSSRRKLYKPRRKARAETASVQPTPLVPQLSEQPNTDSVACSELLIEGTTSVEMKRSSRQQNSENKKSSRKGKEDDHKSAKRPIEHNSPEVDDTLSLIKKKVRQRAQANPGSKNGAKIAADGVSSSHPADMGEIDVETPLALVPEIRKRAKVKRK